MLREGAELPGLGDLWDEPEDWIAKASDVADLYHLELWLTKVGDDWQIGRGRIQGTRGIGAF